MLAGMEGFKKNFNLCFKLDGFMKIKPKLDSKNKNELT